VRVLVEYLGDSIELPVGETLVGRDLACTLRFNDPALSRRHLKFVLRQDEVFVEDLGSSNGTKLNGQALVAPIRLADGDVVVVGTREITIRIGGPDDDQPATLVLHQSDLDELDAFDTVIEPGSHLVVTAQLPVTLPPSNVQIPIRGGSGHQRCPRCGASVAPSDTACATCRYRWGNVRPSTTTDSVLMINRRRHDRHPVELHLVYSSSELEIEATTRDLSVSGVFVCSQVLDPIGTQCQLTLLLDGGPPLHVRGIVRRVVEREDETDEPVGLGVEFLGIGDIERTWLERAVAHAGEA
jgi:hypothetical protein